MRKKNDLLAPLLSKIPEEEEKFDDSKKNLKKSRNNSSKPHLITKNNSNMKKKKTIQNFSTLKLTKDVIKNYEIDQSLISDILPVNFQDFNVNTLYSSSLVNCMSNKNVHLLEYFHFYKENAENFFKPTKILKMDNLIPSSIDYCPSSKWFAVGGWDSDIKIFDFETLNEIFTISHQSGGTPAVKFTNDCNQIASASLDNTGRLWNIFDDTQNFVIEHDKDVEGLIIWENTLLTISESYLYIWNLETKENESFIKLGSDNLVKKKYNFF